LKEQLRKNEEEALAKKEEELKKYEEEKKALEEYSASTGNSALGDALGEALKKNA